VKAWKKLKNRIERLPKLARFWRLTTVRKTHYAVAEHKGDPPMSVDTPLSLWRKAWLARLLNEDVLLEHYDGTPYGGWRSVYYWPARKMERPRKHGRQQNKYGTSTQAREAAK